MSTSQSPTNHIASVDFFHKWTLYTISSHLAFAIDHRVWKTGLPVRSAVLNPYAGRLVVGWVTTSESLLLIVFDLFCFLEMSIPLSIHIVARYLGIRLFLVGYRDYIICFFPYFLAISTAPKSNSNGFVMIPSLRQVEILYHCALHSTSCAVRTSHLFQVYRPKMVRI